MSNKIKVLLLVIVVAFLAAGCEVDYEMFIMPNQYIDEEFDIYHGTTIKSVEDLINDVNNKYGMYYDINEVNDISDFCIDTTNPDCDKEDAPRLYGANFFKRYNEWADVSSSYVVSEYFDEIKFENNKDVYSLHVKGNQNLLNAINGHNYGSVKIDKINVSIYIPFPVVNHNADRVNGRYYYWTITKENYNRDIELSYEETDITTTVGQDKITNNPGITVEIGNTKVTISPVWIITFIFIVIGAIIYLYMRKKHKKNNTL